MGKFLHCHRCNLLDTVYIFPEKLEYLLFTPHTDRRPFIFHHVHPADLLTH